MERGGTAKNKENSPKKYPAQSAASALAANHLATCSLPNHL